MIWSIMLSRKTFLGAMCSKRCLEKGGGERAQAAPSHLLADAFSWGTAAPTADSG